LVTEGLSEESRGRLLDAGYFTLNRFAILAETRAGVRAVLRTECNIDNNLQQTIVIACWEVAKERFVQQTRAHAETEAAGLPKMRLKSDLKSLRKAYIAKFGKMQDSEQPASSYIERLLTRVEEDELEAESLKEVLGKDAEEDLDFATRLSNDGSLKVKAIRRTGKMPVDAEEFRKTLKIMAHAWLSVSLRHSNRPWMQSIEHKVFTDHADYMLGEYVLGLTAKDVSGNVVHRPCFRTSGKSGLAPSSS
jgi:hypothetical protein